MVKKNTWYIIPIIIVFFTFLDFVSHSFIDTSQGWSVPVDYYSNKIIFGSLSGIIAYFIFKKKKNRTFIVSLTTAILLQSRYLLLREPYGGSLYPLSFVIFYAFVHSIIIYGLMRWAEKRGILQ